MDKSDFTRWSRKNNDGCTEENRKAGYDVSPEIVEDEEYASETPTASPIERRMFLIAISEYDVGARSIFAGDSCADCDIAIVEVRDARHNPKIDALPRNGMQPSALKNI